MLEVDCDEEPCVGNGWSPKISGILVFDGVGGVPEEGVAAEELVASEG